MPNTDSPTPSSARRRSVRWITAALLTCVVCVTTSALADDDHDHHHRHRVVLQPRTRIASPSLRQAQTEYNSSTGLMRFALVPEALLLTAGDVLVSEPSAAAPYGYLRRITGVGLGNNETWMTTVPARLDEAIKDAHATATVILPTDGSRKATIVPGGLVIPGGAAPPATGAPISTAALGSSHSLDLEYHDQGIDLSLHGHETSWVGVNVGVDIDAACFFDGDPCFAFNAEAGEQEDAAVTINGQFHNSFSKSFPLANETFDPIVFFIGPVPVVLVPSLDISLNFDGTANGTFAYAAEANAPEYRMGVHWDSANGFSNGFSSTPAHFVPGTIDLVADVDLHAKLPTKVQLLLYDAAGVNAIVTAELDAKFHIPHKPRWSVDGELKGEIGVNASLPIIGDLGSSEATLFDEHFHITESPNNPPSIQIQTPVDGQQVSFNWPEFGKVTLFATTNDDEDGPGCCTVDWFLGDGSLLAQGNDVVAQLPGVGHFVLIARATDSNNASTNSSPVGIDATIPPPGAGIVLPRAACEAKIYTSLPVRLLGRDGPALGNVPYTCDWFSDNTADRPQFPPAEEVAGSFNLLRGCELETFFPTPGIRTLSLLVSQTVAGGTLSIATKTLRVLDPPPGAIPILRMPGPAACDSVDLDSVTGQREVFVESPGGGAGTQLNWTWQAGSCAAVAMPAHRVPTPYIINGAELAAVTPAGCGPPVTGTATASTTDASGNTNSTLFYINLSHQIIR